MFILRFLYKLIYRKEAPYYFNYPLYLILWKPIRKFINVVVVPAVPFNSIRVLLYKMLGFKIGKNVFIGMKCYMDDMEPSKTIIEDNVTISYGVYFACHGKSQTHTNIVLKRNSYIGMRVSICSGKEGVVVGEGAIIGAHSLIIKNIPDGEVYAGVPAIKIK